ncbi:MAG: alpha/beta hydrolase-fold protein [Proteobacteria bacterium]|nr:alpha/beta hydrolase-fold protein [Pseudomonadota bacterium]
MKGLLFLFLAIGMGLGTTATASEYVESRVATGLVPSPVEYSLLAPANYRKMKSLPLVLYLHGGGGSRDALKRLQPLVDRLWDDKTVPPAVFVTPSVTARGFYMNFRDGSERWEDFIIGPFLDHLRDTLPVSRDPKRTFLTGASMGGMGSLRMAFRYPDRFGAVAALEPGIEPILKWEDMRTKHRFWRSDALFHAAYGNPVDPDFWAANNPASIAVSNRTAIRNSGLQIYLEAGDEDQFWLYEGAEFLQQILWNQKIRHEYHLVRGADHVGPSLGERTVEAITFLFRSYIPWGEAPFAVRATMRLIETQKRKTEEMDHYHQPD